MKDEKLKILKHKVLMAASAYWEEHAAQNESQDNAILWMRNEITEEMLCLTKGGYTSQLSTFITKVS